MALSRSDWAEAALDTFARDGLQGVAIEPLARRLGATKGSFYWHFIDRNELIGAMLELWERRETIEVTPNPYARVAALGRGAYAGASRGNAHAAALAAASDPRVRPVLERVTQKRLAFLQHLYSDLGLGAEVAARRARLACALYIGIGELRRADPDTPIDDLELERSVDLAVEVMLPAALGGAANPMGESRRAPPATVIPPAGTGDGSAIGAFK